MLVTYCSVSDVVDTLVTLCSTEMSWMFLILMVFGTRSALSRVFSCFLFGQWMLTLLTEGKGDVDQGILSQVTHRTSTPSLPRPQNASKSIIALVGMI